MPDNPTAFNFRHEELVPLAKLLRGHYVADEADFVELLPEEYSRDFLPEYDQRLAAADKLVSAQTRQGPAAAVGASIEEQGKALPGLLNRLEARARRVEGLTVPLKRLGIKAVRDAYASDDLEKLDTALKGLLHNLDDNAPALAAKGHPAAETEKLRALHQALMNGSATQDANQTASQRETAANMAVYNALWEQMQEVLADGKSLYRGVDKARLKGYTVKELLKRVRQERGE